MKFKRILAVLLSALMLTSMASFTVSAQEDAELTADPILAYETATNQGKLAQNERGYSSKAYDAVNDIVFTHVVPAFDKKGSDNSIYINMYGLSTPVQTTAETEALYAVCYMRSNQKTTGAHAGFYGNISGAKSKDTAYSGDEQWTKQVHTISIPEAKRGGNSTHFWVRPIGYNSVHKVEKIDGVDTIVGNAMAENAYYDVACVVLFATLEDAEAYDAVAKNALPGDITITFDAQLTDDDDSDVYTEFPEDLENDGNALLGWTTDPTAEEIVFCDPKNLEVPTEDVTLYAVWSEERTYNFYKNDGTDEVETIVLGKGGEIVAPTFTSDDKLFLGWAEAPDGEIVEIQKVADTNADYYAIWLDTYLTEIVIAGNDYDANTKTGKLYGINDLKTATELNIVMPYGWPTSIVPTVAAKSNKGDAVYTAPETFDGEGSVVAGDVTYKVTFTVADRDSVSDITATKFSTVNNNGRGGYAIENNTDKGLKATKIVPIYSTDSEYYQEGKYLPERSPSVEGWALFGAHFMESFDHYRALVYYDDGGDGADIDFATKATPYLQVSGAHTRGSLKGKNIFASSDYKMNRWEYIYFKVPEDGYGYTLQTSFNFVDNNNASAFHNDVYYVAELVAVVDGVDKFLQYQPVGLTSTNETNAKNDGTIKGVTSDMEIAIGDDEFVAITEFEGYDAEAGLLGGLAPNTYNVRYAEDDKFAASEAVELTITPDSVEIYFNDGTNTTEQVYEYDAEISAPAEIPTKAGYKFAGWALEGEDEAYDFDGLKATTDLDGTTFVALWEKVTEFYVKGDAAASGDGMSADSPFQYFTEAWSALAGVDGTIYVLGTTKFMGTVKGHGGNVTVTAGEEGAILTVNGPSLGKGEGGSIKFENIEIRSTGQWSFLNFQGLNFEFGEGVVVPTTEIDGVMYYTLKVRSGGEDSYRYTGEDGKTHIDVADKVVVRSGSFGSIFLGGKGPHINDDIYVEFYGGTGSLAFNDSVANQTVDTHGGKLTNAKILLEAAPSSVYLNWITEILGSYQFIANNGVTTVPSLVPTGKTEALVPAGGKWIIHSGEGGRVDFTETTGTFAITTDKTYIVITDAEGNETKYRAADGATGNANLYGESVLELALAEGDYTVSYSDEGVSVNGKFITEGGEVEFALNADNDYSAAISDELVAWAEAHVEAVAGAGYKFSGEFATHDGKYETVDGVLTVEEYTDEVIELYPVAVEDDTLPFYHPVALYDEKNGTLDVTVSIANGKFTAGTVGILYDAEAVEFVEIADTDDASISLTEATPIAKNAPEGTAVAVWTAVNGSIDATATDVAVATFKFNVLDAEEVDGAIGYYVPTVEYDEYFDGVYYQASPVNAEGDDPYAVNYVDVYFGAFEFELAPTEPATITVKVSLPDKAGATEDNITYLAYAKKNTFNWSFIALEEAGNEEETIEKVISDVFFVGETYDFTIVKNGYAGSEVKEITIADGMVIETTFVGGDIKESFTGDDENAVDMYDFGEGEVTLADFVRVVRGFDAEATDEYKAVVDINEDGIVNVTDISIVKANYGATYEDCELVVTYPTEG